MRDLTDKVAVVTGAGAGIGRATALALARRGAHLAVCDIDGAAAEDTAFAVARLGRRASVHPVDVTARRDVEALPAAVLGEHRAVDVVVNNAGIAHAPKLLGEVSPEEFRRVLDVNLWGVVHGSLAFLPHLEERPAANLVNVVSYAGLVAVPRFGPYVVSKFAARAFTQTLQMELRRTGVRVTMICPGATRTSIMANSPLMTDVQRRAAQRSLDRGLARKPERVAETIVRAIQRDRLRALAGPDTVLFDGLARLLPGSHVRLIAPPLESFLDRLIGPAAEPPER